MKLKNYINRHNKTSRKYTICNKNNGFWESNDNRGIYADEQEEGSSNNGGSECVGFIRSVDILELMVQK